MTILGAVKTMSDVLRAPKIKLLPALFPVGNFDPEVSVAASLEYARQRIDLARTQGLLQDALVLEKFDMAGRTVAGTITLTQSTIRLPADEDRSRHVMANTALWAQFAILRRVSNIDAARMERIYCDLRLLRTNYGVVVRHCIDYAGAIQTFVSTKPVRKQSLSEVLAGERVFMLTATAYSKSVVEKLQRVEDAWTSLSEAVPSL